MANRIPESIPQRLILQARKDTSGQLAWRYPAVLEAIMALAEDGYAILGGDVLYPSEDETLDHWRGEVYCGNWYANREEDESWADYIARSHAVTQDYIEANVWMNGDASWFSPVFLDEQGFAKVSRQEK
jgi:hypothetical protein